MRIAIPHEVYQEAQATGNRGRHQRAHLMAYLADKIPEGEELADWERDGPTALFAITRQKVAA